MRRRLYARTPDDHTLRQAAYRVCSLVRSAHLPLAPEVLHDLLDDVGIVLGKAHMQALCQALLDLSQLSAHPGRVLRFGPGEQAPPMLDGAELTARVRDILARNGADKADPYAGVSSVFELGRLGLTAQPASKQRGH